MVEGQDARVRSSWVAGRYLMARALVVATIDRTLAGHARPRILQLKEMGLDVELACRSSSTTAAGGLEALGLRRHEIAFARYPMRLSNLKAMWQLRSVLQRNSFELIDVHTSVAGWLTRLAARLFSPHSTVVFTAHGLTIRKEQTPLKRAWRVLLEKTAGRWTDYLVVINREDEAAAIRYGLVPPDRVRYVPGVGIDAARFDPLFIKPVDVAKARQELGLMGSDVLFLTVGEFTTRKRQEDAVGALARLGDSRAHLALAGSGELVEQVRAAADRLGVAGQTHFLGYRNDIPVWMRASRATVLTSTAEGLPVCVMESLAMEVPVIGTDVRGTRDLLKDGGGILVPPKDTQALAEAMRWMVGHPEEAAEMGRTGRHKILECYAQDKVLEHTERLYREALGSA